MVRGFQFFMIGIRQSQQGKIWPSPRSSTNGRLLRSSHRKFGRIRTKIWSPGENVGLKACPRSSGGKGRAAWVRRFLNPSSQNHGPVEWRFSWKIFGWLLRSYNLRPKNLWGVSPIIFVSFHFRVVFPLKHESGRICRTSICNSRIGFFEHFPPKATESIEPTESSTMNFPSSLRQYTPSILKDFFVKSTRAMWTFWF